MALLSGWGCSNEQESPQGAPSSGGGQIGAGATSSTGGNVGTGGTSNSGGPGLGAAGFGDDDLDDASQGATITFQNIGATGWYPSRRDPATGPCDAYQQGQCCMAQHELISDALSPWNEELIMTLRGPMIVKQFAVYQPQAANSGPWDLVSSWDERSAQSPQGMHFEGNGAEQSGFSGVVGSECLVDAMPDLKYPCGPGSVPYCPAEGEKYYGWNDSKLFVLLAAMPHADSDAIDASAHCGTGTSGNWYDAPWIGLSHGELVRSGKFGDCHCYAKNPAEWWLADGCGQFNAFEVVNDNNEYRNLELFSTNLFAYHGYVGEGPCGANCDLSGLPADVDLIDKSTSGAATQGATATPQGGPGAAFRRPTEGFRYFLILMDTEARTIQLAIVHPKNIPAALGPLLPALPQQVNRPAIDGVLHLRLPG